MNEQRNAIAAANERAEAAESKLREVEAALRGVMDLLKGKIRGEEWWAWERINKDAIARALAPERTESVAAQSEQSDKKPCPRPMEGKGPGRSRCEQNGICQRVDMDTLPKLVIEPAAASPLPPGLKRAAEMDWRRRAWIIHSTVTGERCGSPDDIRYLALALGGEVGELQNLIKKDWRQEWGHKVDDQHRLEDEIDDEIADSAVYLYLLCKARGRDLDYITEKKMLTVQKRYGEDVQEAIRESEEKGRPMTYWGGMPASPLLPGLERAAEIDALEAEIHRVDYERMKMADALRKILDYPLDTDVINAAAQMKFIAVRAFTSPIAAEISRLKGEGSGDNAG